MPARTPEAAAASRRFWASVAAFGALWGGVEITLGAFVHTLRIPFAGTLLAAAGAAALVAQRQLLPARGSALATGLVAALCKSLSPGGIILGPMLGIGVEALLVEAALLAGAGPAAAALAGVLCALWTVLQKLVMQYVYYGGGVVDVYLALLRRAAEWTGVPPSAGGWAVALLLSPATIVGAAGGWLGWRAGREARARLRGGAP